MDFQEMAYAANSIAEDALSDATEVKDLSKLGLDQRASYSGVWATRDFIAVCKGNDRNMQYYGGFEYVEKEYRMELGDWVFYSVEDNRVRGHLSHLFDDLECPEED